MSEHAETLERLLDVLLRQERALAGLVQLAFEEQNAIVHSDYEAIQAVSARMLHHVEQIDALEAERETLTSRIGNVAGLDELEPLADTLGVDGFGEARERLLALAAQLREAQEQNARLILGAVKLRERWLALLTGLGSSTYGAAGRQQLRQERGIVSRSA